MNRNSDIFNSHEFTRKAESWQEVATDGAIDIAGLPEADILGETPCAHFTGQAPAQFFLAHNKHGVFVINTEGYNYARYALKVLP